MKGFEKKNLHSEAEKLKKVQAKNLVKSNKSISFFDIYFKNGQKSIFNWEKV